MTPFRRMVSCRNRQNCGIKGRRLREGQEDVIQLNGASDEGRWVGEC